VMGQPRMVLNKVAYEVGIAYTDEVIGKSFPDCLEEDWGHLINWGDGVQEGLKVDDVYAKGHVIPAIGSVAGGFDIHASNHVYQNAGIYTATIILHKHCWQLNPSGEQKDFNFPSTINVYGRIPLFSFLPHEISATPNQILNLKLTLPSPAPPSNTHVWLEASPSFFVNPPAAVDVPVNATEITFSLQVVPNPKGATTVTAYTDPMDKKEIKVTFQ
jgi:hypothetical protein